jgi:hypothetical protein
MVATRLASGRWRYIYPGRGIFATFSGPLTREAQLWAAVLACGPEATLSHDTAAELYGLIERPTRPIHITVPVKRRVRRPPGVALHRSARLPSSRHPAREPPRTRVEDTVIDLTQEAASLDRASALIADAVNKRLTTHDRIRRVIEERKRLRWRAELLESCGAVADGARSLLEVRYVTRVERPHGLPSARRQVRYKAGGRGFVVDGRIEKYHVRIELDGQRGNTGDGAFRDAHRDNLAVLDGDAPLRFGWDDVTDRPCETAALLARVLRDRGWTGRPRRCAAGCGVDMTLDSV